MNNKDKPPRMIPTSQILLQQRKARIDGKQTYKTDILGKVPSKVEEALKESTLTLDSYIAMNQFAKFLPRGKRNLSLNIPELRDELLSRQGVFQMTDSSGLRSGGLAAMTGNLKAPPKKATKELSQSTILYTIKNKNRLKTNPNYTSWKNNVSI
jgi:hypothetical protein